MVRDYSRQVLYVADNRPVRCNGDFGYQNPGTPIFDPCGPLSQTVTSRKFASDGLGAARGQRLRKGSCAS
jgi:hypothetical protein